MADTPAQVAVACLAPSLAWLGAYARRGEPGTSAGLPQLLLAFGGGLLAGPAALLLFQALGTVTFYGGLDALPDQPDLVKLAVAVAGIGLVEESAKCLICVAILRARELRGAPAPRAVSLGVSVSLGFATMENWYAMMTDGEASIGRALIQPLVHVLFSGLWAVALGVAQSGRSARLLAAVGLTLAAVAHGLYDYILLSDAVSDLMVLPLALGLWIFLSVGTEEVRGLSPRHPAS